MGEKIGEMLFRIANVLHFFGQYERSNSLTELGVVLNEFDIDDAEDLRVELLNK